MANQTWKSVTAPLAQSVVNCFMKIKSILITLGIIVATVGVIAAIVIGAMAATQDERRIQNAFPPGAMVSLKDMDIKGNVNRYTQNNEVEILVRDKNGNNQTITVNENLLAKP